MPKVTPPSRYCWAKAGKRRILIDNTPHIDAARWRQLSLSFTLLPEGFCELSNNRFKHARSVLPAGQAFRTHF